MYIAFKWLFGLTLFMWLLMCSVDVFFVSVKKTPKTGLKVEDVGLKYKNVSMPSNTVTKKELKMNAYKISTNSSFQFLYYAVFCCAGFILSVFNKRKKLSFALIRNADYIITLANLKKAAITVSDTISKYLFKMWKDLQGVIESLNIFKNCHSMPIQNHDVINKILLKKLKDLSEEKKNLSLLLAAANSENRNIKFNYQLESIAKRRLAVYMEDNDKKRKECQSQYVNFQHLYLITHQENLYLHARIKRLTKLKEDAERNLISLVHEICLSKNEKLMAYCSRFVVQSKDKLLNSDMRSEIQKFLSTSANTARLKLSQRPDVGTNTDEKKKSKALEVIENSPALSKAPKLVGLPGEHIWTVKDKDGLIEKLYEYDFTTDLDKGDTIRRIREYSVYHDKDCFLENISSRTVINDDSHEARMPATNSKALRSCRRIHNQRFLTGSEAFQLFLQNTQNLIIPVTASSRPPIFYG